MTFNYLRLDVHYLVRAHGTKRVADPYGLMEGWPMAFRSRRARSKACSRVRRSLIRPNHSNPILLLHYHSRHVQLSCYTFVPSLILTSIFFGLVALERTFSFSLGGPIAKFLLTRVHYPGHFFTP
ncbi:hypothetical protein BDQ12DRAFT_86171 [Crucibulum laeve]|uniref:Uncharacterized protein n=1 Tax=Crucibulum laeve TaxID=68775 RepID=A0A5C3M1G2_9AGAR|nr:hypothetical protein BDQ12DRAFT_86171 [Crucibulum laeve]